MKHKTTAYFPSETQDGSPIPFRSALLRDFLRYCLAVYRFTGATTTECTGYWINPKDGELVTEPITKVEFAHEEPIQIRRMVNWLLTTCQQEAVSIEQDGELTIYSEGSF